MHFVKYWAMQYAWSILFGIALAEVISLPLPAMLSLLIAGGARARGRIDLRLAIACGALCLKMKTR